jgi:hypothetical protein
MDLKKIDTSRFLYNPLDDNLVVKLAKFNEFKVNVTVMSKRHICQYIVLMYDKNNDEIRAEYPFYPQRKLEIAKAVGLIPPKGKTPKKVEDMLIGRNEDVNKMIVRYLTLFNNPDLLMLASMYSISLHLHVQSYSPDFDKNTISNLEKVQKNIMELTENIFGGKDETELRQELYKSIEEQSLGIRPEEVAEALQKGEKPLGDYTPYNKEYLPEKLKFLSDQ